MPRVIKVSLVIIDKGEPGDLAVTGTVPVSGQPTFDAQKPGVGGFFNVSASMEVSGSGSTPKSTKTTKKKARKTT